MRPRHTKVSMIAELQGIERTRYYMTAFVATLANLGHKSEDVSQVLRELLGEAPESKQLSEVEIRHIVRDEITNFQPGIDV